MSQRSLQIASGILGLVPTTETDAVLFRVVWGAIFVGGIGRLLSMVLVGLPPIPFVGFTVLEIVGGAAVYLLASPGNPGALTPGMPHSRLL